MWFRPRPYSGRLPLRGVRQIAGHTPPIPGFKRRGFYMIDPCAFFGKEAVRRPDRRRPPGGNPFGSLHEHGMLCGDDRGRAGRETVAMGWSEKYWDDVKSELEGAAAPSVPGPQGRDPSHPGSEAGPQASDAPESGHPEAGTRDEAGGRPAAPEDPLGRATPA